MRYSVLTYNFGDYELLHEIDEKDPDAEYIVVTDRDDLVSDTWEIVKWKGEDWMNGFDKVCYVRYHCFEFCNTDICVKLDGSIKIKKSFKDIIDKFEENRHDTALVVHPFNRCAFHEYYVWVNVVNRYPREQALRCMAILSALDRENKHGDDSIFQLNFFIQRKNMLNDSINKAVYSLNSLLGANTGHQDRIDQITFSFVVNNWFSSALNCMFLSERLTTDGIYMQWFMHNSSEQKVYNADVTDCPKAFGKPVKYTLFP